MTGQLEPAPADDLEVGEVGLPKLVGRGGRIGEAIGRFHQDKGRTRDQMWTPRRPNSLVRTSFVRPILRKRALMSLG